MILGEIAPGPTNSLVDVAGVRVGHVSLVRGEGELVRGVEPVRTGSAPFCRMRAISSGSKCRRRRSSADLLVVEGDPLQDIAVLPEPQRRLKLVMARGRMAVNHLG